MQLRSLDGIEVLAALETLDVSANKLSNLSPVCKLVQLRVLDVSKNNVTEPKQLEHFRELKNLTNLRFGGHGNPVSLGDKHIPLLLEFAPTLQVIDDMPVELYKVRNLAKGTTCCRAACKAERCVTMKLNQPVPLFRRQVEHYWQQARQH